MHTIGIDASRNRSGGAIVHLINILSNVKPLQHEISEIHVWSFESLLNSLPNQPWLIKHFVPELERSLFHQLKWQSTKLSHELKIAGCDVLFASDASTLCRFKPMVVFSQDLLSYEKGVMRLFGIGRKRIRLILILLLQNLAFQRANGVIFLTHYAGELIQNSCGKLNNVAYIPHGIEDGFKNNMKLCSWPANLNDSIRSIYVSPIMPFKHQHEVVDAISILRSRGHNISLSIVGSGEPSALRLLEKKVKEIGLDNNIIKQEGAIMHRDLPSHLANSNLFIFASSCEAFGITLLEAMAVGLPIASSNRSSLKETLKDGGVYFEPDDSESIANAIEKIIVDPKLRNFISHRAMELSNDYSWEKCTNETFDFIIKTIS